MGERAAYTRFRNGVSLPGDRIDRIENVIGSGFPDTNCCISGTEFWMEIKAPIEPKRATTALFGSNHKLSVEQTNWFLRQRKAKGLGYIYIETDARCILIDGCKWADKVNVSTISELERIALWTAKRRVEKSDWIDLRSVLGIYG